MRLFLIERTDEADWDEYEAVLVRAEDAFEAARLVVGPDAQADKGGRYHGFKPDGSNMKVTPVTADGERGEIISDFKAG